MAGERILVVDDEAEIADLLREVLSAEGFEVDAASDAATALERIREKIYDAALLDFNLPDMDGVMLHRQIRQMDPELASHSVFMSGFVQSDTNLDYYTAQVTDIRTGDYYSLVLFATVGMLLMATATDLILLFLGLEVMSLAVYALSGIWREQPRSNEAALKYFLLGAFATGFLLFGIALLYGATGSTTPGAIAAAMGRLGATERTLVTAGMGLLLVGFWFKVAAAPFHLWTPDVYEGAPTSVTALMAVGVKAAAFAAFARVFLHTFAALSGGCP